MISPHPTTFLMGKLSHENTFCWIILFCTIWLTNNVH